MVIIHDFILLLLFLFIIGVFIVIGIVIHEEHQRKKQCNHLCPVCKYRFVCDWTNREK